MVFGGIEHELLMLNQSTVWSGSRNTTNVNPSAREYLGQMRQLFFEGKYAEGNAVCAKHLCGREDSFGTHLPLAKLRIDQSYPGEGHAAGYQRWLDLPTGVAGVEFSSAGVQFSREVFASNPDQVIAIRLSPSTATLPEPAGLRRCCCNRTRRCTCFLRCRGHGRTVGSEDCALAADLPWT